MLRLLFRLLFFAALLALVAWAVSRFLNREEDFDDFDDIDATLDFAETPVEIDVPYDAGSATVSSSVGTAEPEAESITTPTDGSAAPVAAELESQATDVTQTPEAASAGTQEAATPQDETEGSLIDVNGIGPTYAARLRDAGISSLQDLAGANADDLGGKIEVIGGRNEVQSWIDQAREMTSRSAPTGSQAGE